MKGDCCEIREWEGKGGEVIWLLCLIVVCIRFAHSCDAVVPFHDTNESSLFLQSKSLSLIISMLLPYVLALWIVCLSDPVYLTMEEIDGIPRSRDPAPFNGRTLLSW